MLGEVPSGWKPTTLGEIATESRDRFVPGSRLKTPVPYVGLEHIEPGVPRVRQYGSSHEVSSQKTAFREGDVLFGKLRAYLKKVARVDRSGVCSTDILALRPRESVDGGFLLNLLLRDETIHFAAGASAGTKMPRTSWTSMSELPVLLPPLPEQKKIAAILSSVDEAIQATQAVIDQTRRVKEGLLQDLLTRGIGHTRFKQTEIGEIPEGWDIIALGSLVPKDRPVCYGILKPGESVAGGVPVVKVKNILDGRIDATDLLFTDPAIDAAYSRSRLQTHDVLLTIRGSTGRVAITPPSLANANITQDTARLSIDPARANFRFVFFALQCMRLQRHIELHTIGQAVRGINIADVRKIPITLPPACEQTQIVDVLSSVDAAITVGQQEVRNLARAKSGLLTDLLTGKVRVTP